MTPVILCGGSGTRLWPLSRAMSPKQFVDLGGGRTLFKDTVRRVCASAHAAPIVVCNEQHRFLVTSQLGTCGLSGTVVLEPTPRNTAPAVALAAMACPDDVIAVFPSDHRLDGGKAFDDAMIEAERLAVDGHVVMFGITPTAPETGFGYIRQGERIGATACRVDRFLEKPDAAGAAAMLAQGGHCWNSGMFVFAAATYLEELRVCRPDIFLAVERAYARRTTDGMFIRPDGDAFRACPAESIDYAVMEHTDRSAVIPLNVAWNDLGSWEAFYLTEPKDDDGNVMRGDCVARNVHGCYIHARSRLIAASDVSDMVIVETGDAVLVTPRASSQGVKDIVSALSKTARREATDPPRVMRPWGSYEPLALGPTYQVKRIVVDPGQCLSLQRHRHRSEHWTIVEGTGEVTVGDDVTVFGANRSVFVPVGCMHRLRNVGDGPLVLIEVQCGDYLGEDDIERFDDVYGRVTNRNKGRMS